MEMSGEYRIEAPREKVWAALNDPEILKQSIPGCDEIEQTSDTSFEAQVTAKVGPVKAKFSGAVQLTDIDAPNGYRISGEGKGGAAGFAKGGANVRLEDDGGATLLKYEVDAQVGGKLAQLGARLIDGTAKKMASQFFENFAEAVTEGGDAAPAAEPAAEAPAPAAAPAGAGPSNTSAMAQIGAGTWIGAAIIVALVVIAIAA
jgi:carbon monoxide dehydrogenase subunit G